MRQLERKRIADLIQPVPGVVTYIARLDDEDHVFGDIRRVVADALEMPGNEDQINAGFDGSCVSEHRRPQFSEYLILQGVQHVVLRQHRSRMVDRLRRKLGPAGGHIQTLVSQGYRFVDGPAAPVLHLVTRPTHR
jgi:hypothetical protein